MPNNKQRLSMGSRLFMDLHVIQTFPPSNVNRDDTGSPKTAQYGGVTRSRHSSQSWKKAIRRYFVEHLKDTDPDSIGVRTKEVAHYVAKRLASIDLSINYEKAKSYAEVVLDTKEIGISLEKDKNGKTKAKSLFFIGPKQADNIARVILDHQDEFQDSIDERDKAIEKEKAEGEKPGKKKVKMPKELKKELKKLQGSLKDNSTIDIALFGRMLANNSDLSEEASCQVAHAISTHEVQTEFDYFTATDDLVPMRTAKEFQDETDDADINDIDDDVVLDFPSLVKSQGAMIGTTEYNSATMYRYANVAVHEFFNLIGEQKNVVEYLKLFVKAFVE